MPEICKNCQWWEKIEAKPKDDAKVPSGFCHGAPPSIIQPPLVSFGKYDPPLVKWPVTTEADWCGAHKLKL